MLAVERKIYKLQDKNSILELRSNNHEMIEEAQIESCTSRFKRKMIYISNLEITDEKETKRLPR